MLTLMYLVFLLLTLAAILLNIYAITQQDIAQRHFIRVLALSGLCFGLVMRFFDNPEATWSMAISALSLFVYISLSPEVISQLPPMAVKFEQRVNSILLCFFTRIGLLKERKS